MSHRNRVTLTCGRCGIMFERCPSLIEGKVQYCSRECRRAPRVHLTCGSCGETFERRECDLTIEGYGKYCSEKCRRLGTRTGRVLPCAQCGTHVYRKLKAQPVRGKAFCSRVCWKRYAHAHCKSYPKIGSRHAHRVKAEEALGRPLRRGEIVHHKDGDRSNFRKSNLQVLPNQRAHITLHRERGDLRR